MNHMDQIQEHMVLETAMEAGHILLENGAEIFRVEDTMRVGKDAGDCMTNYPRLIFKK